MAEVRAMLDMLDPADTEAQLIDRIRRVKDVMAAMTAVQAEDAAELEALRHENEKARGVPKARRGNGLAAELGLARGQSPARGTKYLTLARMLEDDMPHTKNALALGQLNEERAQAVVKEVSWLAPEHRSEVDELMAGKFEGLGPRKLAGKVRAHAERLDRQGAVARNEIAHSERRVTVRPAAYGMAYVTALVSTQQAVGILATLTRDANSVINSGETADPTDPTGQPRTHGQVMADLFVQRVNGQTAPQAVPAEVQVVMTDDTLFGDGDTPAWITGHGPIPAELAKRWIANPQADMSLRRIFTRPKDHQLVATESRSRSFPANLRRMVVLRDDVCRTPFCDAPIKEIDHVVPVREGGPTSWENASGLCAACNKIKEHTGWTHQATPERLSVTTPTGHQYAKDTGPVLEGIPPDKRQPPDKRPLPELRLSTDCYATATTQWTAVLRIAA
ncbi:MAG: DUF222 domain-containing protein [Yaniella sp.]|nr:DUF222 domain-containing protein [Yaniella sp.]